MFVCCVRLQSVGYGEDMRLARQYYLRSYELSRRDGLLVRAATLLPMIITSTADVLQARKQMEEELDALFARGIK